MPRGRAGASTEDFGHRVKDRRVWMGTLRQAAELQLQRSFRLPVIVASIPRDSWQASTNTCEGRSFSSCLRYIKPAELRVPDVWTGSRRIL